jgi:hypothetical protein
VGQSSRICQRLGAIGGSAVGLVFWLVGAPLEQILIGGVLVALGAVAAGVAFLMTIGGYRLAPLALYMIVVALIEGLLLAPAATVIPDLFLSILICGVLGMLVGWLTCQLLCRIGGLRLTGGLR